MYESAGRDGKEQNNLPHDCQEAQRKGFNHTWEQCRTKVKNLVKVCKKVCSCYR